MRWGQLKKREKGQTRIIIKFLWRPLTLQNQTRWLELAKVKQWSNMYADMLKWEDIEWADDAKFVDDEGKKQEVSIIDETKYSNRVTTY
jgi:hypothetical protein